MPGFDKLASNARRFKMLVGMSLQEFDLLNEKVEKVYPEAERKRLSKRGMVMVNTQAGCWSFLL